MGESSYVTYCRICNAKLPSDTSFCTECGQSLNNNSNTPLTCSGCGEILSEEYRYCPECGEKIESKGICPRCKAPITMGTRFCTECGMDLDEKTYEQDLQEDRPENPDSKKTGFTKGLFSLQNKPKKTEVEKERYLVCETCRGYYQLQKGEQPEDFSDECECGGKLESRDSKE